MPNWIRVKDDVTGHEFDVEERALRPGVTPIASYPANSGPNARPRPAKTLVDKDGKPANRPAPSELHDSGDQSESPTGETATRGKSQRTRPAAPAESEEKQS
ncbi:hypothetical protein ABZS66_19240 [Dactylosporangium sp. NPDC005572]|uniref:hypothetical protein n=1 Tax=Dactylosporangium sp. NPDC005572 TaxID=3156889 RepID=UPI0033A3BA64